MYRECRASPEAEHTVWWILVARAVERAVIERIEQSGPQGYSRDLPVTPADGRGYGHLAGDKPAPVAWGVRDLDPKCECWLHIAETRDMAYDHIKDAAVDPQLAVMSRTWVVRPLYAQPAAPVVDDAAIARALDAWRTWRYNTEDDRMRAALIAAMKVGGGR